MDCLTVAVNEAYARLVCNATDQTVLPVWMEVVLKRPAFYQSA